MCNKVTFFVFLLILSVGTSTWADFRTVGVYDPDDGPHHNQVDQSGIYGSHTGNAGPENVIDLQTFQQLIGPAFAAGTGGVIDGEGPDDDEDIPENDVILARFGAEGAKSVTFTHTSPTLNLGSGGASGNRLPLSGDHRFSKTGSANFSFQVGQVNGGDPTDAVIYFAASLIERDDRNPAPLVTATFSDGSTVTSYADMAGDGGSPNNKDTFFGFKAPENTGIVSVEFALDTVTHMDEIGFITSPVQKVVEAVMSVEAGDIQLVSMHDVTDPNSGVDPALLDPTHPAWPMAFSTNPNSPLKPKPMTLQLSGSILPETATPSITWSATDPTQATSVSFENANALETNVTFTEPGFYSLTLTVDDGIEPKSDTVLIKVKLAENALQAHWKFDGDPDDPNDYDWNYTTYTGFPDFGPGLVGDAIILKPEDSVSYGYGVGAETSISVAFWMKPSSDFTSDGTGLIRKFSGVSADPQGGWSFQLRSESEMRWRCSSGWDNGAGDLKVSEPFPVDTWTHVVGTYEAGDTNVMRFYLNGQQVAQRNTNDTCFDSFIDEMTIGSANWAGMIDDLYVFDYALNTDEIRPLVAKGMNVAPVVKLDADQVKIIQPVNEVQLGGTVVEEGTYTAAWTVLDKPEGATVTFSDPGALQTAAQFDAVGNYRLALTITDQGTPPMTGSDEIVVKVRPEGFDGLEAHITFDDKTGNSDLPNSIPYVGELFGNPVWDPGLSGVEGDYCVLLDGDDDHINYDIYLGSDPCCTIALWIGNDSLDDDTRIIQKWASDSSGKGWFIRNRPNTPGQLAIQIGSGFSGAGDFVITDAFFPDAAWTHVALTFDGSFTAVYMDGVQVYLSPEEITNFSPADLVTPMVIGYRSNNESSFFTGAIDEVRIYDRALSADELKAIYDADVAAMSTPY